MGTAGHDPASSGLQPDANPSQLHSQAGSRYNYPLQIFQQVDMGRARFELARVLPDDLQASSFVQLGYRPRYSPVNDLMIYK